MSFLINKQPIQCIHWVFAVKGVATASNMFRWTMTVNFQHVRNVDDTVDSLETSTLRNIQHFFNETAFNVSMLTIDMPMNSISFTGDSNLRQLPRLPDKSPRNQTRFRRNTVNSKNSSTRHNKVEESSINSEIVYKQSRMSGEKFHKFLGAKTWLRWR